MSESKQEVARFSSSRIPYHPAIQERFGVDQAGWRALVDAVWPGARTADAIVLALSYCKARKLDPFKRPVHIVGIYSRELKRVVESVWPGIGELRTTAFRTGLYAGREPTEWGPDRELSFDSITLSYPEWAQVTVHRLDRNMQPRKYPGPRVFWLESYATRGHDTVAPNEMWRRRVRGQLDKCAEAAALRAAFPEELGNDYSAEEMEGQIVDHAPAAPEPSPAPLRGNQALRARLQPETEDPIIEDEDGPAPDWAFPRPVPAAPDEPAQTSAAALSGAATPAAEVTPARRGRPRKPPPAPPAAETLPQRAAEVAELDDVQPSTRKPEVLEEEAEDERPWDPLGPDPSALVPHDPAKSIQSWFGAARLRLREMEAARVPPDRFTAYRKANFGALERLRRELPQWFVQIDDIITAGQNQR